MGGRRLLIPFFLPAARFYDDCTSCDSRGGGEWGGRLPSLRKFVDLV